MSSETGRLDAIAADSLYCAGLNREIIEYSFEVFCRYFRGETLLEMGAAEGVMTEHLVGLGLSMTIVEGAEEFSRSLAERYPQCEVVHSLFEAYRPSRSFDNVVLGHVLEHVDDPVEILALARDWLTDDGRLMAVVPNARSIHRQVGVELGMLGFEEELNDLDRHHGHRRVYTPETLRRDFLAAGLEIEIFGGYFVKTMSNEQIEQACSPQLIRAFMKVGERYPDIACEIYVIARRPRSAVPSVPS